MHALVPSDPKPIRDLMQVVADLPKERVEALIPELVEEIVKITKPEDNDLYLRHLVMLCAVVNRAVFEVCEVPKDASVII